MSPKPQATVISTVIITKLVSIEKILLIAQPLSMRGLEQRCSQ
jgi:hypothetical protein